MEIVEDVIVSKAAKATEEPSDWISTRDAADILGCSVQNIHWHIANGNLTKVQRLGEGQVKKPIVMVSRSQVKAIDGGLVRRGQPRRSEMTAGRKAKVKSEPVILECAICQTKVEAPLGTPVDTVVSCNDHVGMKRCPECGTWFMPKTARQLYDKPICGTRTRERRRTRTDR